MPLSALDRRNSDLILKPLPVRSCPGAEIGQERAYHEVAESGRPLAGRSQGQNQTLAKQLRQQCATTHATRIPADSNRARLLALLVAN